MLQVAYKPIIVLCEGLSETTYILCLNKFFNSQANNQVKLVPKIIGGKNAILKSWKKARTENRNFRCVVWLDKDVYQRQEALLPKISHDIFLFNTYNFEDFLVMHLGDGSVMKWQEICCGLNHFSTPMTSKVCEENITQIFKKYKKGSMPNELTVNSESLTNLFDNQQNTEILFSSDFATFLKDLLF
jgi:hypothetical protein